MLHIHLDTKRRQNFGEKSISRTCAAADRTGHAMLHTLYQRNIANNTHFFIEWFALDLIRDAEGDVVGVVVLEIETGEISILHAKTTMLATGGAGRIFQASTNAFIIQAMVWAWPCVPVFH